MKRREEIEYSQRTKEFFMKRDLNKPLCINTAIEWADKTMIDKACEWIQKEVLEDYPYIIWPDIVKDFRKAMEE